MIFTSVAFGLLTTVLIDSLYENLSVVRDISHLDEEHIGENLLLAAMTVFGAGTLFDMKNKKLFFEIISDFKKALFSFNP